MAVTHQSGDIAEASLAGLSAPQYEQLTVARVVSRVPDLTRSELHRLQEYERRHANRKPVLDAIEKALT